MNYVSWSRYNDIMRIMDCSRKHGVWTSKKQIRQDLFRCRYFPPPHTRCNRASPLWPCRYGLMTKGELWKLNSTFMAQNTSYKSLRIPRTPMYEMITPFKTIYNCMVKYQNSVETCRNLMVETSTPSAMSWPCGPLCTRPSAICRPANVTLPGQVVLVRKYWPYALMALNIF